jgi:hypothetical protein
MARSCGSRSAGDGSVLWQGRGPRLGLVAGFGLVLWQGHGLVVQGMVGCAFLLVCSASLRALSDGPCSYRLSGVSLVDVWSLSLVSCCLVSYMSGGVLFPLVSRCHFQCLSPQLTWCPSLQGCSRARHHACFLLYVSLTVLMITYDPSFAQPS